MTEEELLTAIRDLGRYMGFISYHTHRSDRSEPGFPDLVLVHPRDGRLLVAELKSTTGRVSAAQHAWLGALSQAKLQVYVWRPHDLKSGAVARALTAPARDPHGGGPLMPPIR